MKKVHCPFCKAEVARNRDETLRAHKNRGAKCEGAGLRLAEALRRFHERSAPRSDLWVPDVEDKLSAADGLEAAIELSGDLLHEAVGMDVYAEDGTKGVKERRELAIGDCDAAEAILLAGNPINRYEADWLVRGHALLRKLIDAGLTRSGQFVVLYLLRANLRSLTKTVSRSVLR